jgi:hypothetical protein
MALAPKKAPLPTAEEIRRYIEERMLALLHKCLADWPKARRPDLVRLLRECAARLEEEPAPDRQAGGDQSARESSGGR